MEGTITLRELIELCVYPIHYTCLGKDYFGYEIDKDGFIIGTNNPSEETIEYITKILVHDIQD